MPSALLIAVTVLTSLGEADLRDTGIEGRPAQQALRLARLTVANGLDLLGYSSSIKYMVTGAILLAAVTLDTVSRRRLERAGR